MAIQVTCPSCFKRFTVSDKFAGRTGPCPKCQKPIQIPEKTDEVVIHAPQDSSPKDSKGRSVLKPLRRKEVKLGMPVILGVVIATLVVFAVALGLGLSVDQPPVALLASTSIALGLALAFAGYWFLHDDELEGYSGHSLLIRSAICGVVFAATWGLYAFLPGYMSGYQSTAEITGLEMFIYFGLMIALGTAASVLVFELEFGQGLLHYMLYFALSFSLAWLSGAPLGGPLSEGALERTPTRQVAPEQSEDGASNRPEDSPEIPNLLQ